MNTCARPMHRELILAAIGLALLLPGSPAFAQKATKDPLPPEVQERLKEFKKFVGNPEPRVRSEQMERLSAVDFVEGVDLLKQYGLKDDSRMVQDRAIYALSCLSKPEAVAAIVAGLKDGNDAIRAGCVMALAKSKSRPDTALPDMYALAADPREDVKVAACEALGFVGRKEATPAILTCCTSGNERVAVAAADSLSLIKDPAAAPTLIGMLNTGTWRTQVAAVNALGQIRVKESVGPLIKYLTEAEGRPREDAKRALELITTQEFGMNTFAWNQWWKGVESSWTVPPPAVKKGAGKEEPDNTKGDAYGRKPTGYHHIKTYSQKLLFVIDVSSSMLDPIRVKRGVDKNAVGTKTSRKIDIAREELAATLRTLDEQTKFNVIAFETDVRYFRKEAVSATKATIEEAVQWVQKQEPRSAGSSGGFKTSSGTDENGWLMGRTNTYAALKAAFGLPIKPGKRGMTGGTTGGGNPPKVTKPATDTVFFLTDGEPTEGETTNIDEILEDVRSWNKSGRMVINTIGMSETNALRKLLDGLAEVTNGKTVYLGE